MHTYADQCPVQQPPITAAMSFVIQLRYHLHGRAGLDAIRPFTEPAIRARDNHSLYSLEGVVRENPSG